MSYHIESIIRSKMLPLDILVALRKNWQQTNFKVVFTNGVFDILHAGHVESLIRARELGDKLIVGLNTDASVKRLKGENRPIIGEEDRLFLLASLQFIDAVILFQEDTPIRLIEALLPDVLVKSADYNIEN